MARKKFEEEPVNHERWLVSYADFITLLFAFFVVMYAVSSLNEGKYRVMSSSLGTAFGKAVKPSTPTIPLPNAISGITGRARPSPIEKARSEALRQEKLQLTGVAREIQSVLAPLVRQGKVRVTQSARGISVEINASVLFAPGEARLTEESGQALTLIASILKNDRHAIQIEGHTDNLPIKNNSFPSNWELSAVRASSVVRLFVENGVSEDRLTAVGHGANQPVGDNQLVEGRLRNRRVEVTILSQLPDKVRELPVQ